MSSERKPPESYECPFTDTCTAPVTQGQYESYCSELSLIPKDPNYMVCPAYQRLLTCPRMWRQRIQGKREDAAFSSSRTRGVGV